jgi:hypothetical protein
MLWCLIYIYKDEFVVSKGKKKKKKEKLVFAALLSKSSNVT